MKRERLEEKVNIIIQAFKEVAQEAQCPFSVQRNPDYDATELRLFAKGTRVSVTYYLNLDEKTEILYIDYNRDHYRDIPHDPKKVYPDFLYEGLEKEILDQITWPHQKRLELQGAEDIERSPDGVVVSFTTTTNAPYQGLIVRNLTHGNSTKITERTALFKLKPEEAKEVIMAAYQAATTFAQVLESERYRMSIQYLTRLAGIMSTDVKGIIEKQQ